MDVRNRILLHGKPLKKREPKISDKNVERQIRVRRGCHIDPTELRVLEILDVSDPEIETQGIQLAELPKGSGIKKGLQDQISFPVRLCQTDVIGKFDIEAVRQSDHSRAEFQVIIG